MRKIILRRKSKLSGQLFFLSSVNKLPPKVLLISDGGVVPLKVNSPEEYKELNLTNVSLRGFYEYRGYGKTFVVSSCKRNVLDQRYVDESIYRAS